MPPFWNIKHAAFLEYKDATWLIIWTENEISDDMHVACLDTRRLTFHNKTKARATTRATPRGGPRPC